MSNRTAAARALMRAADPLPPDLADVSDDTLETALGAVLGAMQTDPASVADQCARHDVIELYPEDPPHHRRARQAAPWLAAAALVAVAVAAGVIVHGAGRHEQDVIIGPATGVASPIIRTPVSPSSQTSLGAVPRPPDCQAAQLSASVGESGPAAGTEMVVILLHNISANPCWLSGIPGLSAVRSDGSVAVLGFRGSTDPAVVQFPTAHGPGALQPGDYGAFIVTECLADECAKPATAEVTLRITLATGGILAMPYPAVLSLGTPGTETEAEPVPAPTGILGH